MIPSEHLLLWGSVLLLISVLASKAFGRLGVPALLIFLGIGMAAGSEGIGGIAFDNAYAAQALGVTALVFILFSGGLSSSWREIRPVFRQGLALSTLGVLVTAAAIGAFSRWLLGLGWIEGLLLGAVVSSTDAAAVFSILSSRSARLHGHLNALLEFESGSNDPMAVFLTLGLIELARNPGLPAWELVPLFVRQIALGGAVGFAAGQIFIHSINRIRLEHEGLYPVLTLAGVIFVYGATAAAGGSGFLAVYVLGLMLGNRDFIHRNSLIRFHDGLAWLMQIAMFLTLGLLVFPSRLVPIAGPAFLVSLFLMLVARPLGVFASLAASRLGFREKLLISWVGLRGAAPIVLATFPLLAGIRYSGLIFNVVFFAVLTSVLFQGTTLALVARALGLSMPMPTRRSSRLELTSLPGTRARLQDLVVPEGSWVDNRPIVELGVPKDALIVLIERAGELVVPRGDTRLKKGDILMIVAAPEPLSRLRELIALPPVDAWPRRAPGQK